MCPVPCALCHVPCVLLKFWYRQLHLQHKGTRTTARGLRCMPVVPRRRPSVRTLLDTRDAAAAWPASGFHWRWRAHAANSTLGQCVCSCLPGQLNATAPGCSPLALHSALPKSPPRTRWSAPRRLATGSYRWIRARRGRRDVPQSLSGVNRVLHLDTMPVWCPRSTRRLGSLPADVHFLPACGRRVERAAFLAAFWLCSTRVQRKWSIPARTLAHHKRWR
jgi:hypothetical protein